MRVILTAFRRSMDPLVFAAVFATIFVVALVAGGLIEATPIDAVVFAVAVAAALMTVLVLYSMFTWAGLDRRDNAFDPLLKFSSGAATHIDSASWSGAGLAAILTERQTHHNAAIATIGTVRRR